jgi:hypothetical protein
MRLPASDHEQIAPPGGPEGAAGFIRRDSLNPKN